MKFMLCEICEGKDFLKEDGVFVCQNCGTKYSTEEAKKLMVEADRNSDNNSFPNSNVSNLLELAQHAIDQSNNIEAENYANKVLETDSNNAKAWLIKGQAVGWQSTIVRIRLSEMSSCFKRSLENASEEELDDYNKTVQDVSNNVARALMTLACDNFSDYPSEDNVKYIQTAMESIADLLASTCLMHVFLDISLLKLFCSQKLNEAAVKGSETADENYGPNLSDKTQYKYNIWLSQSDHCLEVLRKAMIFAETETMINQIVKNFRNITNHIINSHSYKFKATEYSSGYVKDFSLSESAKSSRKITYKAFLNLGNDKIIELKKAAREKYWDENSELKEELQSEKKELSDRIEKLEFIIKEIENRTRPEIEKLINQKDNLLPEEQLVIKQEKVIENILIEKKRLGLFKVKEKKALQAKIDEYEQPKLDKLKEESENKRKAFDEEIRKKISDLESESASKKAEIDKLKERIDKIDEEFNMDRL